LDIVQDVVGLYLRKCWTFFKTSLDLFQEPVGLNSRYAWIGLFCSSPNLHFLAEAADAAALYSRTILEKKQKPFPITSKIFPRNFAKEIHKNED
jgi:hypothetical protein